MKKFLLLFFLACSGESFEEGQALGGSSKGSAGQGGKAGGGQAGQSAGGSSAGQAGQSGQKAGGAGQAGAAGGAGQGGAGEAGQSAGGSSGEAGGGQAGQGGAGEAGQGGASEAGQAGEGGAGQAGEASAGQSGEGGAGEAGQSAGGSSGEAGAGQAGQGGGGQGGEGGGGQAGQGPEGPPSCKGLAASCAGENCCASDALPGGSFLMGRGETDAYLLCFSCLHEMPEHTATVAPFALDRFEASVARVRQFVAAYDGFLPQLAAGAAAHPLIPGSGWQPAWLSKLPPSAAALSASLACGQVETWTATPGANEDKAANCLSWFVAFAFCAWDGGRLPTEAEWEFAAVGAEENRVFPWGADEPNGAHAEFSSTAPPVTKTAPTAVGSHFLGRGRWGHYNMGGNVNEWVLDTYNADAYQAGACSNCAHLAEAPYRVQRGGNYQIGPSYLRGASRDLNAPTMQHPHVGVRCARPPK